MKTIKITLITAMIALGAILFGQADMDPYINADYSEKCSRFENMVRSILSRTERTERDGYKEPVVYMSYTIKQADVIYEENYYLEDWMTSPFESTYAEAELILEDWMTSPFDAVDHIKIESWMTAAF